MARDDVWLRCLRFYRAGGNGGQSEVTAAEGALADLSGYQAMHGNLTSGQLVSIGDLDGDGLVTNADLQGLIVLLANGGGSGGGSIGAVPEPSCLALIAIGGSTVLAVFSGRRFGTAKRVRK